MWHIHAVNQGNNPEKRQRLETGGGGGGGNQYISCYEERFEVRLFNLGTLPPVIQDPKVQSWNLSILGNMIFGKTLNEKVVARWMKLNISEMDEQHRQIESKTHLTGSISNNK